MLKWPTALALLCASSAIAQQSAPPRLSTRSSDPAIAAHEDAVRAAFVNLPDTEGTGPYKALKEVDPGLPDHVVYRPRDLSSLHGKKLGVLVWGNGGCSDDGASGRQHLAEIASYGYLAIAPGKILNGPGIAPRPRSTTLGVKTTTADVLAGLDWALAENLRKGSPYYGRIDPRLTAVSGHSCGGLQAIQAAADPRIHAVIIHDSGIFANGANPITGMTVDKSLLLKLHTPILYVLGGPTDVAWPNGTDDVQRIRHVSVMLGSINVGHGGTIYEPNGGIGAQVARRWLEWQLRGDQSAGTWFKGPDCKLCTDHSWTITRKGIQ